MFNLIKQLYWKLKSPIKYARHLGVRIGDNTFISTRKWSTEPYLITIGNNVQVTQDVYFHTHGGCHVARDFYPRFDVFGKIIIEDGAYIGSGAHIMPGVTVGKGSLIAAGSIVTKSIPPHEVWGGSPAHYICDINTYIQKNIPFNLDTKDWDISEKKKYLEMLSDEKFIKK